MNHFKILKFKNLNQHNIDCMKIICGVFIVMNSVILMELRTQLEHTDAKHTTK